MSSQELEGYSKEAEAHVLGACLMATAAYDVVADAARIWKDGDALSPANQPVWQAIVRLHGASRPTGVPMVEAELRRTGDLDRAGGLVRLSQLASAACGPGQVEHYADPDLVQGHAAVRRYQAALARAQQTAGLISPTDVADAIRAHQADLDALAVGDGEADVLFGRLGDRLHEHLKALEAPVEAAAVTGLMDLDAVVKMRPGNVIVVPVGPPWASPHSPSVPRWPTPAADGRRLCTPWRWASRKSSTACSPPGPRWDCIT
ncbi:DnaB-like helicase N-terminal domain-containing protein [Streptomyces sp. NPDC007189]|uniref:DnaB-like helicase N-terminal domain-containing protein n=1 Tax=Streptomyces sp. NPDC007189 TaxID=3154315 RepID=UPI00345173AE